MINKEANIFVTGATGFLGTYILRELLESGYKNILALRRSTSPNELVADISDKIEWVEGNVLDLGSIEEAVEKADYIIHSAALVSFDPGEKMLMYKINVEGTANLVNLALEYGIKKFVYISSVASLGRIKSGIVIDENTEWEESQFNSNYGISKRKAELEVWRACAEGLEANIINPSYIVGGGFWDFGPTQLVKMIDKGMSWYPGGTNGVVDVRDVAYMSRLLMEHEESGRRYVSCAENISYQDLFSSIAQRLGKEPPKRRMKKWMGALGWRLEALRSKITGNRPIITRETVKYSAHDFLYNADRSRSELSMKYRPASQTLDDTVSAYLQSKKEGKNYAILNLR